MDYETFEKAVAERAGIAGDEAGDVIRATLETLAERLTRGEADDLAAQLPKQMKGWLTTGSGPAERFGLDEFVRRVGERAEIPPERAREAVRAVFKTLREAVTGGEFKDVMSQLPSEFSELVDA
jgi:uncharacterized protein (DUF2267 family)